jgi:hypothetical protein
LKLLNILSLLVAVAVVQVALSHSVVVAVVQVVTGQVPVSQYHLHSRLQLVAVVQQEPSILEHHQAVQTPYSLPSLLMVVAVVEHVQDSHH